MTPWGPAPYKRPPMLANVSRLGDPGLGVAPALVAKAAWPWIWRLGLPLLVGAGIVAATGALVKSAVPTLPIETARIPTAALLGGAGAAAYYGTELLPEKWKPVGYILSVAGIAGSIYWLFSGTPQEPGVAPQTTRNPLPNLPIHVLNQLLPLEFDPDQPFTNGSSRSVLTEQNYRFKAVNQGSAPLGFFAGLLVLDDDLKQVYRTPPIDKSNPDYGRQEIHVNQAGWTEPTLKHPALGIGNGGWHHVEIEIFRNRDDVKAALVSQNIPVTYSLVG